MSSNIELELAKESKTSQQKYIYFLLAVAASAIGFAVTQSKIEPLAINHIPLGVSVSLWAISFYSGLQCIEYQISSSHLNWMYLASKRDASQVLGEGAEELISKIKVMTETGLEAKSEKMNMYGKRQSISLLVGALFYICWHILKMYNLKTA